MQRVALRPILPSLRIISWVDRHLDADPTGYIESATASTHSESFELCDIHTLIGFFDHYPSLELAQWLKAFPPIPSAPTSSPSPYRRLSSAT
jgi:hypothetical protein